MLANADGFTCYERDSGDPPPPGCADPNNLFISTSGDDYCVYDEYMSGDNIKSELLDSSGNLLPQVPTGNTCEANGWFTIYDEQECMTAGKLLLADLNVNNFMFELDTPRDYGNTVPSGCFYHRSMASSLNLNTNTGMGPSTSQRRSICRRGWKRYSLGKQTCQEQDIVSQRKI